MPTNVPEVDRCHAQPKETRAQLGARARALATFLAQAASRETGPGRVARHNPLFYRPPVCLPQAWLRSPGIESHVIANTDMHDANMNATTIETQMAQIL